MAGTPRYEYAKTTFQAYHKLAGRFAGRKNHSFDDCHFCIPFGAAWPMSYGIACFLNKR